MSIRSLSDPRGADSAGDDAVPYRRAGQFVFASGLIGEPSAAGPFSVAPVKRQANAIYLALEKQAQALGASLDNTVSLQQS